MSLQNLLWWVRFPTRCANKKWDNMKDGFIIVGNGVVLKSEVVAATHKCIHTSGGHYCEIEVTLKSGKTVIFEVSDKEAADDFCVSLQLFYH